ncbi:MAG: pseudouridine synthase [Clostridia bacterium]|nr:pseudouridine synthase [Clostridia bacterium]
MPRYYMFHKPKGAVTARRDDRHKTVMDYFPDEDRDVLFPVGRLDKDTEGFLIVTDDGAFTYRLLSPESGIPKTYFFYSLGVPDEKKLSELSEGVSIYRNRADKTAPAKIEITESATLRELKDYIEYDAKTLFTKRGDLPCVGGYITITEGKKHQVKRMLRYAGGKVVYLKRVKIGRVALDPELPLGKYREMTEEEIKTLS